MHKRVILRMHVYADCDKNTTCHTIEWDSGTQKISIDQEMFPEDLQDFSNFVQVLKQQHLACDRCKKPSDAR